MNRSFVVKSVKHLGYREYWVPRYSALNIKHRPGCENQLYGEISLPKIVLKSLGLVPTFSGANHTLLWNI